MLNFKVDEYLLVEVAALLAGTGHDAAGHDAVVTMGTAIVENHYE